MSFNIQFVKDIFSDSLCTGEIGFTPDGYLSPCFMATYLFSPIAILLTLWAISDMRSLDTNHHPANTTFNRIKFALTALYTIVIVIHGPKILNMLSLIVSMFSLCVVFILSFLDLKGVYVPQKPLEVYFFLVAAVTGYLMIQFVGRRKFDQDLLSSIYICLVASLAGSVRNIISAFDDAQVDAKKPKSE